MNNQPNVKATATAKVIKPDQIHHVLAEGAVGLALEYTVTDDKTGKITSHGIQKSESFVQQFLQLLFLMMNMTPPVAAATDVRDTSNTLRNVVHGGSNWYCGALITDATYGIQVGTGNTAPVISNYVMETLIAHGVAGGQLQYSAVTFAAPAADATTSQFTITRNFANGSGGAITVNEIGLVCRAYDVAGSFVTVRYFLIVRDVIGGGIAVPNGQTLTINYRPQAVV